MIRIILNGEPKELEESMTLSALLETLGVDARLIAIGYNGEVVGRDRYAQVTVQEGDHIDIVHMVGGG